jgi:hypothetical protein
MQDSMFCEIILDNIGKEKDLSCLLIIVCDGFFLKKVGT